MIELGIDNVKEMSQFKVRPSSVLRPPCSSLQTRRGRAIILQCDRERIDADPAFFRTKRVHSVLDL